MYISCARSSKCRIRSIFSSSSIAAYLSGTSGLRAAPSDWPDRRRDRCAVFSFAIEVFLWRLPSGGLSRLGEPVVSPISLIADDDGRHAHHATRGRLLGGLP